MANIALSLVNRATAGTVSGAVGSWVAAAPAANVIDDDLAAIARSTDATTASTKIRIDLGAAYAIGVIAFGHSNLSSAAQMTIKGGSSAGGTQVHNGAATNVYGATPEGISGRDYHAMQVLGSGTNYTARYWDIEISDTGNSAGYVEVGQLFLGAIWQPTDNPEHGSYAVGRIASSVVEYAWDGTPSRTRKRLLREVRFALGSLTTSEAQTLWDAEALHGNTEPVMWLPDPADTAACTREAVLGLLTELGPLEHPWYAHRGKAYAVRQL